MSSFPSFLASTALGFFPLGTEGTGLQVPYPQASKEKPRNVDAREDLPLRGHVLAPQCAREVSSLLKVSGAEHPLGHHRDPFQFNCREELHLLLCYGFSSSVGKGDIRYMNCRQASHVQTACDNPQLSEQPWEHIPPPGSMTSSAAPGPPNS